MISWNWGGFLLKLPSGTNSDGSYRSLHGKDPLTKLYMVASFNFISFCQAEENEGIAIGSNSLFTFLFPWLPTHPSDRLKISH